MKTATTILLTCMLTALSPAEAGAKVKPGVEVLRDDGYRQLAGKRVGLITNPTGVDTDLRSTADLLHSAHEVNLTALFAPEHGVRGDIAAGATVAGGKDAATGLPVHSLYGKTRKPTAAMLADIDALVYDIQDNGCRSYTFISTLGKAMEACIEHDKEMVVLDRPNPLGGNRVEGPVTDPDCISFVSQYRIPYIYGLTAGELALYLNDTEFGGKARLTVVPMEGWTRTMTYADTGMPWVLTSPHIPSAETTLLYPATGIMGELDYISIGVGYTMPFRVACARWIDAARLTERLNALNLPGIRFRPLHIKPYYGFGKGEQLHGVELHITDPDKAELTLIQFYIMQELAAMYPENAAFKTAPAGRHDMFDKVCGSRDVRRLFARSHRVADILDIWHRDAAGFKERSARYHLYR